MEPPKKPPRPRPIFDPDATPTLPRPAPPPDDPGRVKPYNGSCPNCEHGSMFPLARFYESDVNENPTADAIMPNKMGAKFFPGLSLALMLVTWIGGMTWDKNRVARGRLKVRRAREEILPRCPQAVICPQCFEVLERF